MKHNKLSVVVSAFNEEKKIEACLESVNKLADEIIVVNNSSTDNTLALAKKYTQKIFTRPNNSMLNVNKNFGFSKATGDWILNLDADERVTPELRKEIISVIGNWKLEIGNSRVCGYWIPRKNIIFGKWIQSDMWWPDYQLRLFKKSKGIFPEKHVHEKLVVEGQTEKLREPFLHYNYETISQFIQKMDRIYTESEAKNILESNQMLTWADAIRMPIQDFMKTYFAQKGYKDGLHGLVLSILQAMYMEVVFAKVWEKQGFKEEKLDLRSVRQEFIKMLREIQYWFLTSFIQEAKNPITKLALRVKRKLHS